MSHIVKITSIRKITHDVLEIKTEKPGAYSFVPGQATEVAINQPNWLSEKRPFTFTCLPTDDFLEFIIKSYADHNGVTHHLATLKAGDELILEDSWGEIHYKGEGVFIAGGAGITPFISIFRDLSNKKQVANNKLIFANKRSEDIILKDEFSELLGANFINILSGEKVEKYNHGYITEDFLKQWGLDFGNYFYLCAPDPMMNAVEKQLLSLGVKPEFIVKEG